MTEPWAIYIDIEGFSDGFQDPNRSLTWLRSLMRGIYLIGNGLSTPLDERRRISAYQFGDGFFITGLYGLPSFTQPISIAIALMRYLLLNGGTAKAAISFGDSSDITSCYPSEIQARLRENNGNCCFNVGAGIMCITPVMGSGLVATYKMLRSRLAPAGSLLLISNSHRDRIPTSVSYSMKDELLCVDWVHSDHSDLSDILSILDLESIPNIDIENKLRQYIDSNATLPDCWRNNTLRSAHLESNLTYSWRTRLSRFLRCMRRASR